MKFLMDNRFAPITFRWGFVENPFPAVSEAFIQWQGQLDEKFGMRTEFKNFHAPFSEGLFALEPLTTPLDRYLLTETRSGWTAIFANGLRTNDVHSPVSYLPTVLKCRGLEVACVPERGSSACQGGLQIYGFVQFALYGPNETDWLNRIRSIYVMNDISGWEFAAQGEVQPYEQLDNYRRRKIVERFTPEMLESYCAAIGIELFKPEFYGNKSLLVHSKRPSSDAPVMSIAEARSHLCM